MGFSLQWGFRDSMSLGVSSGLSDLWLHKGFERSFMGSSGVSVGNFCSRGGSTRCLGVLEGSYQ